MRGPKDQCSSPDRNTKDRGERQDEEKVEEEEIEQEKRGGEERVSSDEDYDTDLEIEGIEEVDFRLKRRGDKKVGKRYYPEGLLGDMSHMFINHFNCYFLS